MASSVSLIQFLVSWIQAVWAVSLLTAKLLIPSLLALGIALQKPGNPRAVMHTLIYSTRQLLMYKRKQIVYGLVAGGAIALLSPGTLIPASAVTLLFFGHALLKTWRNPPSLEHVDGIAFYLESIAYASAILLSLTALALNTTILNSLSALFIYGIIFWRI